MVRPIQDNIRRIFHSLAFHEAAARETGLRGLALRCIEGTARLALLLVALASALLAIPASAQAPAAPAAAPPPFATTKVSDNVYLFRYGGHQSIFVVTSEGVIATDPIAYLRPQAARTYIEEIRKITAAPIKYVVYSHHHYDHIAGGKPFKDLGATFTRTRTPRRILSDSSMPTPSSPTKPWTSAAPWNWAASRSS